MTSARKGAEKVGLPTRVFLYTLDQIGVILDLEEKQVKSKFIYYDGRSTGIKLRGQMMARDISPLGSDKPDWRVADKELIRWLKFKGYRYVDRGYLLD